MSDLIVIPARYGSTRLPGKPLVKIAGRMLVERVAAVAMRAAKMVGDAEVAVATDDERIAAAVDGLGLTAVMTDAAIASGSDRALAAAKALKGEPAFVVNLQGDAPFAAAEHIVAILAAARGGAADITTPVVQVSWEGLERMRAHKTRAPASGTTCVRASDGRAIWFSKTILPFIRDEAGLKAASPLSPVFVHVGLYCFRFAALEAFASTPPGVYERIEGLEQLRALERGMRIETVPVETDRFTSSGIDDPEDARWAERVIAEHGDPFVDWRSP